MPRPSQCPACGCFETCLYPSDPHCAERKEIASFSENEVHRAERDEHKTTVGSYTEMERAHFDTDMR